MNFRILLPAITLLTLTACVSLPTPLQGEYAAVTPTASAAGSETGMQIRWGGTIIETIPDEDRTCFYMLSRPLNGRGRPDNYVADATQGRFIACRAGFYEPTIFTAGREITFIGEVDGYQEQKVGTYNYRLPLVNASVVYLWPIVERVDVIAPPAPMFYDPYYNWGGPWHWGIGHRW